MTNEELQSLRDEVDYLRQVLLMSRKLIGQWLDEYIGEEGRIPSVIDYINLMKFIDPALIEQEE